MTFRDRARRLDPPLSARTRERALLALLDLDYAVAHMPPEAAARVAAELSALADELEATSRRRRPFV